MELSGSCILRAFAITALVFLLVSTVFGREMMMRSSETDNQSLYQVSAGKSRELTELDYEEAGPNTNTKSGFILSNPSPLIAAPAPQGP